MPRRKKEEAATSNLARQASPPALPVCEPPAFQLAVINSCLYNEDIRLPQRPTPAMLARFYHECDATVTAAAAAGASASSLWGTEYWRTRVPHVPLGRHSALPAAYQLRHECAGRLQARVVYVHAPGVHRQLRKAYPAMDVTRTTVGEKCGHVAAEDVAADDDDVVVVVEQHAARRTAAVSPPPPFTTPYHLLLNHGANPVFVGAQSVPQGRSVVLCDGDVVSFLECAFDEDGGVLDAAGSDCTCSRSPGEDAAELETTVATPLSESVVQLANASLMRCLNSSAGATPAALTEVSVSHGLVGTRRLYEVPHMVRDYMRWWRQQQQQLPGSSPAGAVLDASPLPAPSSTTRAATAWMVAGNHLVRAPSIASDTPHGAAVPSSPPATPARDASRKRSRSPSSAPLQPAVVEALRHWLQATEEVEEVAEQAPSPLAAQLLLDRAWLWQLVRCHRVASMPAPAAVRKASASPQLVKAEEEADVTVDKVRLVAVKHEGEDHADTTAERFRVSLQVGAEDASCNSSGGGATPSRTARAVQFVLDELRRSRGGALASPQVPPTDQAAEVVAGSSVRRSLCLELDPIEVYADEVADSSISLPPRDSMKGLLPHLASQPRAPGIVAATLGVETSVPGVRVRPAALPVYIFTARRGRSPDVHTRERVTLALPSPASPASAATAAAKQFVYYYEEPDETAVVVDGGKGTGEQPHAAVVDATVAAALLWVDETEETSDAVAPGRQQQQRRRLHRKTTGSAQGTRRTAAAAPPRTPPPAPTDAATTAIPRRCGRPRKSSPR